MYKVELNFLYKHTRSNELHHKNFIILFLVKVFRFFLNVDKNLVLYHSFPDFSDNSFAFFCYSLNNNSKKKNVWLVDHIKLKENYIKLTSNYSDSKNYLIVKKKSLLGIYYFCKSKYIFHTHGLFNLIPLSKKCISF